MLELLAYIIVTSFVVAPSLLGLVAYADRVYIAHRDLAGNGRPGLDNLVTALLTPPRRFHAAGVDRVRAAEAARVEKQAQARLAAMHAHPASGLLGAPAAVRSTAAPAAAVTSADIVLAPTADGHTVTVRTQASRLRLVPAE